MNNINRDSEGKFTSYKSVMFKWFGIPAIVILVGIIGGKWYQTTHPIVITKTVQVDVSPAMFAQKIDSLEKSVVAQVEQCESGGIDDSFGLITYDPKIGGKNDDAAFSIGKLQFKKKTVIYYYKTLYNKTITGKEAVIIALDASSSEALAKDVMFQSSNLATDWANCSTRLNLSTLILAIKKIK